MNRQTRRKINKNNGKMAWILIVAAVIILAFALLVIGKLVWQKEEGRPNDSSQAGISSLPLLNGNDEDPNLIDIQTSKLSVTADTKVVYDENGAVIVEPEMVYTISMPVWVSGDDDAFAINVRAAFSLAPYAGDKVSLDSWVFADNAKEKSALRKLYFVSDSGQKIWLEYVYGEAMLTNDILGTVSLSDKIVTAASSEHGVQLGMETLNGDLDVGQSYACTVQIKVIAHAAPYDLNQKWRMEGEEGWRDTPIDAPEGSKIEVQLKYVNADGYTHRDVMIELNTSNLELEPKDFLIYNAAHTDGMEPLSIDPTLTENDWSIYAEIGSYKPGAEAILRFPATVIGEPTITTDCGFEIGPA